MDSNAESKEFPQTEDRNERLERLAKIGSWSISADGVFAWSAGARHIIGLPASQSDGDEPKLSDLVQAWDRERFDDHFACSRETLTSFALTCQIKRLDGETRDLEIAGEWESNERNSNQVTAFGTISDISHLTECTQEVEQTRDLLVTAINSLPIRVFWKDLDSTYLGCNKHFAQDAGLKNPNDTIGKTDFDFFAKESADYFRSIDRRVMDSGVAEERFDERQQRGDGTNAWLRTSKVPLRNPNGDIFGVLGTYEDITEEKERERKYALTHFSMEEVQSAIFWCNPDGFFFYANQSACDLQQNSRDELLNMHVSDINPNIPKEAWPNLWDEIKANGAMKLDTEHLRKDGSSYPAEVQTNYVCIDDKEFLVSFVLDITERKESERQLIDYQFNLEKQVERRTKELKEANSDLESFAYSVSHDLRAPLRGIDGFSQALLEDYEETLDDDGKHYLRRIRGGIQRMSSLIDDILQLSYIGRKDVSKQSVDLSRIVELITSELKDHDPQRVAQFEIDPEMRVFCDQDLIRIALENLIGNAWKYSSKEETTRISVRCKTADGESIICIEDNGTGFDTAYAGKLFAPFQRLHRADEYKGNGIGLATVHRIIKKHAGSVWAESTQGEGSRFYFKLPPSR